MTTKMRDDWKKLDLRKADSATAFQLRPCSIGTCHLVPGTTVVTVTPDQAAFWGVYFADPTYATSHHTPWRPLADFLSINEAIAFLLFIAKGRPVTVYDPLNGARPIPIIEETNRRGD